MNPIDLVEQKLTAAGCDPKRRGDKITAKCPAHDDSSPSLSVGPGTKRDIVMTCFAGCKPDDIMAAVDLKWTDFGEPKKKNDLGLPSATYDYTDADGTLLYQVVRYVPKTFRQRRPDGRGGWIWGLGDVPRTLYHLPDIAAAIELGYPIYVVEGEKDVDALRELGLVATCNSGGAGKFTMDMAAHLEGADVVIVADNDDTGRQHATEVAWMVKTAGAKTANIMGPARGKDVSDHLTAGLGIDDLIPIDLEPEKPPEHPLARWRINWGEFWSAEDSSEDRWLLEPLFAKGRGHAIYAGAKTGKSYVVLAACAALATGKPFMHHPGGEPVEVLYVDYEMTEDDLRDRLEEFGYGPEDDLSHLHYILLPSIEGLDTEDGGSALVAAAMAVGAVLVIIDTTGRAVEGEENSADTFRAFYRHTGLGLKQAGIAFARLDHAGKDVGKGQRGSSGKNDDVDVVIQMTNLDNGKRLKATHRRMGWYPETTDVEIVDGEFKCTPRMWRAGTKALAAAFDEWGVPLDMGGGAIVKVYKAQREAFDGPTGKNYCVEAQQFRKQNTADWTEE